MASSLARPLTIISTNQEDLETFLRRFDKRSECIQFIPQSDDPNQCFCGRIKQNHALPSVTRLTQRFRKRSDGSFPNDGPLGWSTEKCTTNLPTDAFGTMGFAGRTASKSLAKYVRVSSNTDPQRILELLYTYWIPEKHQYHKPNLVISVTGDTSLIDVASRVRKAFSEGLERIIVQSNAWVLTGGYQAGFTKLVGHVLKSCQKADEDPVPCIGFCTWGYTRSKQGLVNTDVQAKVRYTPIDHAARDVPSQPLDSNHTHFILVDDGTEGHSMAELDLRNKFIELVATQIPGDHDITVPFVTFLVGGWLRAIKHVEQMLQKELPVVVVKGSGGVADLLVFALNSNKRNKRMKRELAEEVIKQTEKELADLVEAESDRGKTEFKSDIVKCVMSCIEKLRRKENKPLVQVYDACVEESGGLDFAALNLIMTTYGVKRSQLDQAVRLAMQWNRPDILREEIISERIELRNLTTWDSLMDEAMLAEKPEFVVLFLDYAVVDIAEYLSEEKLVMLYNHNDQHTKTLRVIRDLQLERDSNFTKEQIDRLCRDLYDVLFCDQTNHPIIPDTFDQRESLRNLFLWALLTQRWKLADVFWVRGPEPLTSALTAGFLLRAMAKRLEDGFHEEAKKILLSEGRKWGFKACKLVQLCDKRNSAMTEALVKCTSDVWSAHGHTPMTLAIAQRNKEFAGCVVVQRVLVKAWMGKLKLEIGTEKILSCAICPLFIPFLIEGEKDKRGCTTSAQYPEAQSQSLASTSTSLPGIAEEEKSDRDKEKGQANKFVSFYYSPVAKFWLNFTSYLFFLCFFCYSLLVKWDSTTPTRLEILTAVWVVSLIVEDIHQIRIAKQLSWLKKFLAWWRNVLDIVKMAAFLLFIVGAVLRYVPHAADDVYPSTFRWARIVLSFDICLYFMRGLEFFFVSRELGPKLTMIYRMVRDVVLFIAIIIACLFSYGVAVQALLFPFEEPSWSILKNVVYVPYWQIYGELFLEQYTDGATGSCIPYNLMNGTITGATVCPQNEWLALVLLVLYLTITVLILLNLLIAIFSNTYEMVNMESDLLWKFQRHRVVTDYIDKSVIPHPLAWIAYFVRVMRGKSSRTTADKSALCLLRSDLNTPVCRLESLEAGSMQELIKLSTDATN